MKPTKAAKKAMRDIKRMDPSSSLTEKELDKLMNTKRKLNYQEGMGQMKKNAKSIIKMVERNDPNSAVSDSEYKAAMKKLGANKTKNEKEYRKQGY